MNSSEKFYKENLYPLQDGILKPRLVVQLHLHIARTGGKTELEQFPVGSQIMKIESFYKILWDIAGIDGSLFRLLQLINSTNG